jgi:ferredoxin
MKGVRVMAITRVWIEEGCISCGLSEGACPEVFKVTHPEGSKVIEGVNYSGLEEKIKKAAKACPVKVIKYDEDDDVLAEMFAYDDGASNEAT